MTNTPRYPRFRMRYLLAYWAAQAVVAYAGYPLLLLGAGWRDSWDIILQPTYAGVMGSILALIMAAQAALVMPIRPPTGPSQTRLARWSRHGMGGLAAGAMAAYLWFVVLVTLSCWHDAGWIGNWATSIRADRPWVVLFPVGLVTPVTTLALARCCKDGTPAFLSVLIAACLAASLVLGLLLAANSLAETVLQPKRSGYESSLDGPALKWWWLAMVSVFAVSWLAATPLLLAFIRTRDRETALGRIAARLFLGSVIEAGAIIPLDVMVRRKSGCYCAEGTMWALTLCWGVGTLALGPAVWLLPFSRRRKRWLAGRCEVCGYDMSGCMSALNCPECGAGWKAPPAGVSASP